MKYHRLNYCSSNGLYIYDFLFCYYDDLETWRIYIINEIDYPSYLKDNFHLTHRLHDLGETYDYICWSSKISTFEQAKGVASLWADVTAEMLASGGLFDDICFSILHERG